MRYLLLFLMAAASSVVNSKPTSNGLCDDDRYGVCCTGPARVLPDNSIDTVSSCDLATTPEECKGRIFCCKGYHPTQNLGMAYDCDPSTNVAPQTAQQPAGDNAVDNFVGAVEGSAGAAYDAAGNFIQEATDFIQGAGALGKAFGFGSS